MRGSSIKNLRIVIEDFFMQAYYFLSYVNNGEISFLNMLVNVLAEA